MSYDLRYAPALLTAEDEARLAQAIEAGGDAEQRRDTGTARPGDITLLRAAREARHHFIEANLRLVLSIASKARIPDHVDRDDVIQDGMIGLDRAVSGFDWRRGYKFSTYATWWIRQSIQRCLENTASTVRVPAHRRSELGTLRHHSDFDLAQLPPGLAAAAAASSIDSLDRMVGDTTVGAMTAADDDGPERAVEWLEDRALVRQLLATLDATSAAAVTARFGLDGGEPSTYAAIGECLGVSAEAARRRVARSLRRLRPRLEQIGTWSAADDELADPPRRPATDDTLITTGLAA